MVSKESTGAKVSVIVPVYNAEKYLVRTINSVLAQTYKNFELLLVDDGSKDKSAEICKQFAASDERVKYFYKTNGGVSSARNFGIEKATGVYIAFMDNDDAIKPDYLEVHVNNIGDCDLLLSEAKRVKDGEKLGGGYENITKYEYVTATTKDKSFKKINNSALWDVWCKLYRRNIIIDNHIRFENMAGEDVLFTFTYMALSSSIRNIKYSGYYWLVHSTSLSHHSLAYTPTLNWINKMLFLLGKLANQWGMDETKYKEEWQYAFGVRFAIILLKGYIRDTAVSRKARLKTWKDVAHHDYFKTIPLNKFKGRDKLFAAVARYRLYYFADPFLKIYANIKCK